MNDNPEEAIPVKLVGSPACRRYQKMRASVLEGAERLKLAIQIREVVDTESLSKLNPLSLPRLYIGDILVASQNPPKPEIILQALNGNMK